MVRIVYTIGELLSLRHNRTTYLNVKLPKILPLETKPQGKNYTGIHGKALDMNAQLRNCIPYGIPNANISKENNSPKEYLLGASTNYVTHSHKTSSCNCIQSNGISKRRGSLMNAPQYPLFNIQMFPPGSRIIRIEPGVPIPVGAIPIPFIFEDNLKLNPVPIFGGHLDERNDYAAMLQNPSPYKTRNSKGHKQRKSDIQKLNISIPTEPSPCPNPKSTILKYDARKSTNKNNPYSISGFFPKNSAFDGSIGDTESTDDQKLFSSNLADTSQTSVNDTDSQTTIDSSDSFNIQIQISAAH